MQEAVKYFRLQGNPTECERYGSGHINETHLLKTDAPHAYILQKINHRIFKDVPALMKNIAAVTRHLATKDSDPRHVLTLVPTTDGADWHMDESGEYWRVYEFVTDSLCMDRAETEDDFRQSALAFGQFQNLLADFPADSLSETIPHFHDTPARYAAFHKAIDEDVCGRLKDVQAEVDFYLAREKEAGCMMEMLKSGELPLRVTHNDTKLNNVMLDAKTRTPLCVIDLDTVMPGLAANDFGDSIRFGASTATEDERDLSKVSMSLALFKAYTEGFLSACGERLSKREIETLPMGAKLMTLECGMRFLTDHLQGDTYFAVHRENHNLDRTRTQLTLVADMERKWDEMAKIVCEAAK